MDVNYLAYADAVGRNNANADGLKSLRETLEKKSDRQQEATLRGLQIQQAQLGIDDATAKQGALAAMGGGKLQDAYKKQMTEEDTQKKLEAKQKGFQTYLNTIGVLDKMEIDPKTKTAIGKEFLRQNPEYAPMVGNLTFLDSKGVKAAREFKAGELKDPITNQPLPAGFYETEGMWTGDATQPVKLVSYKLTAPPNVQTFAPGVGIPDGKGGYTTPVPKEDKPEYKFRERTDGNRTIAEESQDNGRTWKKVSEGPRYKPASAGGGEPVAQTTFVDPESGKPLVFDKSTGSYRVANVEGGVAPKPGAMSPEQATRAQQFETIVTNIPKIRDMVLDKNGNIISKLDIANSQIGTWGTKGREIRQAVKRTVEQALRIATGAAAPDSEVASYTEMYAPQVGDTKEMIAEKFRALETFAEGTRAKFNVGRSAQAINRGNGKGKANAQPKQGQTGKGSSYADLLNKHKR